MAVLRTQITGPVRLPDGSTPPDGNKIIFTLTSWDKTDDAVIMHGPVEAQIESGAIDVSLHRVGTGLRQTAYRVDYVYHNAAARRWLTQTMGLIAPDGPGPYDLADLLAVPSTVPDSPSAAAQAIAAALDAQEDADRAEAAWANAALGTPYGFETVPDLLANTSLSYTSGAGKVVVTAGHYILAGGHRYQVAASGASDHHVTTAGGVKLMAVKSGGARHVDALGAGEGIATDDIAAFAKAATVGGAWRLTAGTTYLVSAISLNVNGTTFSCQDGLAIVQKNASGTIFSGSANDLLFDGVLFRGGASSGSGLTGNNLDFTGDRPTFTRCGSQWAAGRALKSQGGACRILASAGVWQTDDTTPTGYDLEIGKSGTATLYHQLQNIVSSQATGGVLLVDTGSHVLTGGQFGKFTIQAGTRPAGSNGGMTLGARILGDVTVELSNGTWSGNQFSTQTITFGAGTSAHQFDLSNIASDATIVNNGNSNSVIMKSVGSGSPTGMIVDYGGGGTGRVRYVSNIVELLDQNLILANNKALQLRDAAGTAQNAITLSSGDDWAVGANNGANFMSILSGTGGIYLAAGGVNSAQVTSSALRAAADGVPYLGGAANRWNTVYAVTGTINTSDAREKTDIADMDAAERRVGQRLRGMVRKYRYRDAVSEKGQSARLHIGVVAQEVIAAFEAEGLDPTTYGIVCYDEWGDAPEKRDDAGNILSPAVAAGNRYGIRYEELLMFVMGSAQ